MLNEQIRLFKNGDDLAFSNIISLVNKDINNIIYNFNIPGKDIEDLRSIAMEQVFDCLQQRSLKRGKGTKKVLNENDDEKKNLNFIKSSIKYRLMRELRSTKANIRVSYDIPFLDDNGNHYLDRKGKPLYIGVIFRDDKAYLIQDMKNMKLVLNISKDLINKNVSTYDMKNPIDNSTSLESSFDNGSDDIETRDYLEFNTCKNDFIKNQKKLELNLLIDYIDKKLVNNKNKDIIKNLLNKSRNLQELKDFVNKNKKEVNKIKNYILEVI